MHVTLNWADPIWPGIGCAHQKPPYRADFWPTAGSGNRTNFAPGRLVIAPGGLGAPLGINLAWFAPKTLILNWLALRGLRRAMLLGPPKGPRSERTRRLRNSNWLGAPLGRRLRFGPLWPGIEHICGNFDFTCHLAPTEGPKSGVLGFFLTFGFMTGKAALGR